ncbi:MAG: FAD:protein FMN transferase [Acidobacteriota bacterium]
MPLESPFGDAFPRVGWRWVRYSAVLVLGVATVARLPALPTEVGTKRISVERQVYLMGTVCQLRMDSCTRSDGLAQLESFVRVLESTEEELSTWREESFLSRINRQPPGVEVSLPSNLCSLLATLFQWHIRTEGAFDPAVGALIEAWDLRHQGRIPSRKRLSRALRQTGLKSLRFNPEECTLARDRDVWIDAGGFGKGEALDRVFRLANRSSNPWMVNLGGQIMVGGGWLARISHAPSTAEPESSPLTALPALGLLDVVHGYASGGLRRNALSARGFRLFATTRCEESGPRRRGWKVTLADPRYRHRPLLELSLTSGSLATSGGSEKDLVVDGSRLGHILDPRTGRPAPFTGSVTVWHERALMADILSTALYVMGPVKGLAWARKEGIAACYLVPSEEAKDPAVQIRATPEFSVRFLK